MKKLFLGLVLFAGAITLTNAQTTSPEASKWSISLKGGADYYRVVPGSTVSSYLGFDGVMAKYLDDASWNAGISLERTFNPLFGMGLDVSYLAYNRNTLTGHTIDPTLFGSVNVTNLLFPHRTSAKFNLFSKFGVGAGFYDATPVSGYGDAVKSVSPLGTTSLLAEWNLGRRIALGAEAGYRSYLRENLGGSLDYKDANNDAFTANIALRIKLGKLGTHINDLTMDQYYPAPAPVVEEVANPYDDSALTNRLDNADKRLDDIESRLAALEQGLKDLANKPQGSTVDASFQNIEFAFNSDKLTSASNATLDQIATLLNENPTWGTVKIAGNTDNIGSKAYNQKLSEKRAAAVKKYLVSKGVSASALSTVGYGETKPIASNDTAAGRQQNRRVEFSITK